MLLRPSSRSVLPLAALAGALIAVVGCSSGTAARNSSSTAPSSIVTPAPSTTPPVAAAAPTVTPTPSTTAPQPSAATSAPKPKPKPTARSTSASAKPAPRSVRRLPLDLSTGNATQVITVVSSGRSDTTATVQRWTKADGRWTKVGSAVDAYVGAGGIGKAHEGSTRTPAGSFTLTQAFGRNSDPGTRLPYTETTNDDYWISNPGPLYNTRQRCGDCGYDKGINEHLRAVTPEYDYAAVIDYNTRNAPGGVEAGQGSAFFLHVANGEPTAGCVALPRTDLVRALTWLNPADHPRILIGVD